MFFVNLFVRVDAEIKPAVVSTTIDKSDSIDKALAQLSLEEESQTKPVIAPVESRLELITKSNTATTTSSESKFESQTQIQSTSTASVPPSSADIENFYKEVQRYEKVINGLTTKTLNGTTPLETKWKELHDSLNKDASKRTVSVSKLFPEKNRNMLSVPYDHSRVLLPTETDNYINAAHIKVTV